VKNNWKSLVKIMKNITHFSVHYGQHCQKIVSEVELEELMVQGWRVAAVPPSGKIVVSSD
jgi:hypothetical protein